MAAAARAAEVTRILANALRTGSLPEDDVKYVGRVIADLTDLSRSEAEQRVRNGFARLQTTLRETEQGARTSVPAPLGPRV